MIFSEWISFTVAAAIFLCALFIENMGLFCSFHYICVYTISHWYDAAAAFVDGVDSPFASKSFRFYWTYISSKCINRKRVPIPNLLISKCTRIYMIEVRRRRTTTTANWNSACLFWSANYIQSSKNKNDLFRWNWIMVYLVMENKFNNKKFEVSLTFSITFECPASNIYVAMVAPSLRQQIGIGSTTTEGGKLHFK